MKTRIVLIMLTVAATFSSCEKDLYQVMNEEQTITNPVEISLKYSAGNSTKSTKNAGSPLVSGQSISGNIEYHFSFWLEPADTIDGVVKCEGIYTITTTTGNIVYGPSAYPENGIDFRFPEVGAYTLTVTGNYMGQQFSYSNITVNVTGGGDTGEIPPTSPVRLKNFVINGANSSVDVEISTAEYPEATTSSWYYISKISNVFKNWQSPTSVSNDSIFFTLTFPTTNNLDVWFTTYYNNGTTNGCWLTASASGGPDTPPSILYNPNDNENMFHFRLFINGEGEGELRNYQGVVVASTNQTNPPDEVIPGNNGDGAGNYYTVRWSGYKHYIKTNLVNPGVRYKIGQEGSWSMLTATISTINDDYWEFNFPEGTTGEVHFQWGTGTGTSFQPTTAEMTPSMYWNAPSITLVKNI